MCYLKNIASEQSLDLDSWTIKNQDTVQQEPLSHDQASETINWGVQVETCNQKHILLQLFDLVHKNSEIITKMNESLCMNSQQVKKITINFENHPQDDKPQEQALSNFSEQTKNEDSIVNTLRGKLFGSRRYRYSLQTVHKFEPVLYKERNFNIELKLVNKDGKHVRNSNLLNLCFALCNSEGQWIHENRVGDSIMKGKTETELIKGEAFFQKLYSREVSRIYSGGRVSIVIYPKPTNLRYNLPGPCEEVVNIQDIEPLIITDVSIRAKKKE